MKRTDDFDVVPKSPKKKKGTLKKISFFGRLLDQKERDLWERRRSIDSKKKHECDTQNKKKKKKLLRHQKKKSIHNRTKYTIPKFINAGTKEENGDDDALFYIFRIKSFEVKICCCGKNDDQKKHQQLKNKRDSCKAKFVRDHHQKNSYTYTSLSLSLSLSLSRTMSATTRRRQGRERKRRGSFVRDDGCWSAARRFFSTPWWSRR